VSRGGAKGGGCKSLSISLYERETTHCALSVSPFEKGGIRGILERGIKGVRVDRNNGAQLN